MTDEEKQSALAFIKLHEDVRQLIVDVVYKELCNYGGILHSHIQANVTQSQQFKDAVRNVIKDQMNKY